jgi:hypothetical protein
MITIDSPWRQLGAASIDVWRNEFTRLNSPMLPDAAACCEAAGPHGALALAQAFVEDKYATTGTKPEAKNPLNLRPGPGQMTPTVIVPGKGAFLVFSAYADCFREWRRRLFDEAETYKAPPGGRGPYALAGDSILDLIADAYAPKGPPGTPEFSNDPGAYARSLVTMLQRFDAPVEDGTSEETPTTELVFGQVPHPDFLDRLIPDNRNRCWDDLGQRTVKGVVYHRQLSALNLGTENYFNGLPPGGFAACPEDPRDPTYFNWGGCRGLTDYGVAHNSVNQIAGEIRRWNDPTGQAHPGVSANRAAWASGPVSQPYGDGKAFLDDNGGDRNVVNRDQVSIEISGFYNDPVENACKDAVAALSAYWADQFGIPWNDYPTVPGKHYSFVRWHQEYTIGTGKVCPGKVVMDATDDIIHRTALILKKYQTGSAKPKFTKFGAPRSFHAVQGAMARRGPSRSQPVVKNFAPNELIECDGFYTGQFVMGDDRWLRLSADPHWVVHSSGVTERI